jgi:hypothetical protein
MNTKKTKKEFLKKFELTAKQLHFIKGGVKFKAGSDLADAVQAP